MTHESRPPLYLYLPSLPSMRTRSKHPKTHATKDRTFHPDLQRFVAKRIGATTVETASSHVPMLSNHTLVLDVIRKTANAVRQR